jgi:transcriptional regulator with XRE-family HTH domain
VSEDADRLLRRVGLRIIKRRQELGLTQQQLAAKFGMHQSNLAQIEQGKQNLTVRTLAKLATVLGVKVAELFAEDPGEPE